MTVLQRMVDVIKCALIYRVHINAAVIQGIPKMDPNVLVSIACVAGARRLRERRISQRSQITRVSLSLFVVSP